MFRAAARSFSALLAGLVLLACTGTADAGFVFMKNGYIIQGRVVERDDDKIVLRWVDGTMTIEHRFISELVLDAGEQRELEIRASLERIAQPGAEDHDVVESEVPLRLPENIEEIMSLHGSTWGDDGGTSPVVGAEAIEPPGDDPSDVSVAPDVGTLEPTEVRFEQARCALTPAPGWDVMEESGMIRVHKSGAEQGPALTIQFQMDAPVDERVARTELRESLARSYPDVEGLTHEDVTVASQPALRVDGTYPPRGLRFTEFLVRSGDAYYLIALLEPQESEHQDAEQLQAMLDSLRFLAQ